MEKANERKEGKKEMRRIKYPSWPSRNHDSTGKGIGGGMKFYLKQTDIDENLIQKSHTWYGISNLLSETFFV